MAEKPPFDTTKAAFLLVAMVIAVHCLVVMGGVVFCGFHPEAARCADLRAMLGELLTGALAAALAFAGGMRRDK
jgi:hypothetical protein